MAGILVSSLGLQCAEEEEERKEANFAETGRKAFIAFNDIFNTEALSQLRTLLSFQSSASGSGRYNSPISQLSSV